MPDSSGFGSYTESGMVIPCTFRGTEVNFVAQMYLDDDPPIAAGREIWGFPKKYAHPKLEIVKDTLTGTLDFETRSGQHFILHPGAILLAEDTCGGGHKWKLVDDQPWRRVYVVFAQGASVPFQPKA